MKGWFTYSNICNSVSICTCSPLLLCISDLLTILITQSTLVAMCLALKMVPLDPFTISSLKKYLYLILLIHVNDLTLFISK